MHPTICPIEGCFNYTDPRFYVRAGGLLFEVCDAHGGGSVPLEGTAIKPDVFGLAQAFAAIDAQRKENGL